MMALHSSGPLAPSRWEEQRGAMSELLRSETLQAVCLLIVGVINLVIALVLHLWPGLLRPKDAKRRLADRAPSHRRPLDQARLDDYLRAGEAVRAIKLYHDATGASLAEAKDAIEARAQAIGVVRVFRPRPFGVTLMLFGVIGSVFVIVSSLLTLMR